MPIKLYDINFAVFNNIIDTTFLKFLSNCCHYIKDYTVYKNKYLTKEYRKNDYHTHIEKFLYDIYRLIGSNYLPTTTNVRDNSYHYYFQMKYINNIDDFNFIQSDYVSLIVLEYNNSEPIILTNLINNKDVSILPTRGRLITFNTDKWCVKKKHSYNTLSFNLSLVVVYINKKDTINAEYFDEEKYLGDLLQKSISLNKKLYINQELNNTNNDFILQLDYINANYIEDYNNDNDSDNDNDNDSDSDSDCSIINEVDIKVLATCQLDFFKFPRCYYRFNIPSFFENYICEWIIKESELYACKNNGWLTKRHDRYPTTDLEVCNITPIFSFFSHTGFNMVKQLIEKLYTISISSFNVQDFFIAKYEVNQQINLAAHYDGDQTTNFSFSILLNNDFEGATLMYKDGGCLNPTTGEIMIHTKCHKHAVSDLTKGTRYVIVGFLEICL